MNFVIFVWSLVVLLNMENDLLKYVHMMCE